MGRRRTPLRFPLPANGARGFCWLHALAADAAAPTGDIAALRAMGDTLEQACSRSIYGRDWRLYHHVRGLVAMAAGDPGTAEREFSQAVWTSIEGWSRTTVEVAAAQMALGRPRDAIATLRTGYATRLDAMGRYVPISELDYRMALAFAAAGQADSARVYGEYARRAWRSAEPEVRRLLARLPDTSTPLVIPSERERARDLLTVPRGRPRAPTVSSLSTVPRRIAYLLTGPQFRPIGRVLTPMDPRPRATTPTGSRFDEDQQDCARFCLASPRPGPAGAGPRTA